MCDKEEKSTATAVRKYYRHIEIIQAKASDPAAAEAIRASGTRWVGRPTRNKRRPHNCLTRPVDPEVGQSIDNRCSRAIDPSEVNSILGAEPIPLRLQSILPDP
ncbi:MAG: hypothetical protein B6244_13870 [Candidatus Cloacimonetes bacterium 4572_55]|nr:MAG: hypothetical protein B6244_13870 [Candidatus Cloacimonetes bacterium 4572_55]